MKVLTFVERVVRPWRPYLSPAERRTYAQVVAERGLLPGETLDGPTVLLDFHRFDVNGPLGRRAYLLHTLFAKTGRAVVYQDSRRYLASLDRKKYKKPLLKKPFRIVRSWRDLAGPFWWVTDRPEIGPLPDRCEKRLRLRYDGPFEAAPDRVALPFSLHPNLYEWGLDRTVEAYRSQPRPWRLFFAGNFDRGKYNRDTIRSKYRVLPRVELLETLLRALPPDRVRRITSSAEFEQAKGEPFRGFVLVDTGRFRVDPRQWLETVARADYFVGAPGVGWPMSHNVVEAMAVGTVPLLEYGYLFVPALRDGRECRAFRGAEDLLAKVGGLWDEDDSVTAALRKGAAAYYDDQLRMEGFLRLLEVHPVRDLELHVAPYVEPR